MKQDLDHFTRRYAEAALWDSTDQDGATLGVNGIESLAPATVRRMRRDCADFRWQTEGLADTFDPNNVARDFWLERNQRPYGGFWDADYPRPAATVLTRIARRFGRSELFLDDEDGLVHSR